MLIFDPYRWIADRRAAAPSPLAPLAALAGGRPEFENSISERPPANPANPANPSGWCEALARLDPFHPPQAIEPDRWRALVADACWLAKCHGPSAAALGWTAIGLFGLDRLAGWGGLADRLAGARQVALTEGVAHWRADGLDGWLWRKSLRPMPTIWEAAHHG